MILVLVVTLKMSNGSAMLKGMPSSWYNCILESVLRGKNNSMTETVGLLNSDVGALSGIIILHRLEENL